MIRIKRMGERGGNVSNLIEAVIIISNPRIPTVELGMSVRGLSSTGVAGGWSGGVVLRCVISMAWIGCRLVLRIWLRV